MKTFDCIVLTGGGTAGHVTVNLALQNSLKKHFKKIVYVGSKNGIEKNLVQKNTCYEYKSISTVKFDRKHPLKIFSLPFKLLKCVNEAKKLLKKINPNVIFSKGGYVGLPVVIAGKHLGIPVICHESDFSLGLANRIAKHYASVICTNFKQTANQDKQKCIYTGSPLKLKNENNTISKQKLGVTTSTKPVLLVTGGSLGAKAINNFVFNNLPELTKTFYVIHLVGKNNLNKEIKLNYYKQIEFSNDMPTILNASDYAISRAGANTVVELLSNKVLTIFVPLPKGVSRGDQIENAKYFESKNMAKVVLQEDLTIENIKKSLNYLQNNMQKIKHNIENENIVDGTNKIVDIILKNAKKI